MGWRYEPLDSGEIRLLKPLRRPPNDLSFEVVHVSLSLEPHYAALSYTWGPPGDTHSVLLNGQPFPIRKNLYDALLQLQNSKLVDKYLWVDAICINQGKDHDALHERSVQITLMKQIYEQAAKVFVWLGKPENETYNRLAFQKMKYFKKQYDDRLMKARPYRPWWFPAKPRTAGDDIADSLLNILPAKDKTVFDVPGTATHRAWLGIISLWKKPWWTRTWVFQESTIPERYQAVFIRGVTLLPYSTKVKFLCGDQKTSWNALGATHIVAINILATPDIDSKFLAGAAQFFAKLEEFRGQRVQHVPWSFLQILQMFRHTACFDPRDKVYAPLCLAPDDVRHYIRPDYDKKTILDVYTDVVRYFLAQPGHYLDFLGCAKHQNEVQAVETPQGVKSVLPSWVPNFSANLDLVPIPKILYVPEDLNRKRVAYFDKGGVPNYNGPKIAAYSPLGNAPSRSFIEGSELHVSGVYIDVLKDIIPDKGPDMEAARAFARERERRWAMESGHVYPTGESWADAINRTTVLDVVYDYLERPSERGGKHDAEFLKKPRTELSLTEYRYQMNMRIARRYAFTSRNLGLSQKFYMLVIPDTAVIGDAIWALSGGQALYILRPVNRELKQYRFIGECYAHGLMDGEIVRMLHTGEARMEDISCI